MNYLHIEELEPRGGFYQHFADLYINVDQIIEVFVRKDSIVITYNFNERKVITTHEGIMKLIENPNVNDKHLRNHIYTMSVYDEQKLSRIYK